MDVDDLPLPWSGGGEGQGSYNGDAPRADRPILSSSDQEIVQEKGNEIWEDPKEIRLTMTFISLWEMIDFCKV